VKSGPGGLQDIELVAQAGALISGSADRAPLAQLRAGAACGWLTEAQADRLSGAHRLFSRVHQSARLLSDEALVTEAIGTAGRAHLATQARAADFETLAAQLDAHRQAAAELIDALLPAADPAGDADHG
jgi:glutamate-ammonia-ligase adenylyltransferase